MDFPHIAIRESVDRSWTPFLLAAFEDPSTPDQARRELRLTLMDPGDPRAIERLLDVLVDPRADTGVRAASAELLGSQGWIPDSYETRRAWWHSGDPVLQRAALGEMDDHHDGDLVYAVASDPQHPHHRTVLMRSFCWSFAAPRFQPFKLAGLRHEDARVREYMAWEIMVDETAAAEPDLHRLARDADADVRDAAHYALEYFPTRQTLRFADECRDDTDLARIADYLAGEFGDAAAAHPGLAEWMKPVEEIVGRRVVSDACDDDGEPDDRVHTPPRPAPVRLPVDAWLERLANPDGEWASFGVRNCYWSIPHVDLDAVAGPDRQRLTRALIHHADPAIRGGAAYVAAAWDDLDALLQLAHDNQRSVRFSAVYYLGQMPKDPAVARFLADLLDGRPPRRFKLSE
ncbi:MAG: HEAT repeat domain-containing protein, partial [Planctomycetota bacterium]